MPASAPFEVKIDPRVKVTQADLQKQFDLLMQIHDQLSRIYNTVNQVQDVRSQVESLKKRLPDNANTKALLVAAGDLDQKLVSVRDDLIQIKIKANEDSLAYPQRVDSKLAGLAIVVGEGSDSAPTAVSYEIFGKLKKQADVTFNRWTEIQKTDLAGFQKMAAGQNIQAIDVPASNSGESRGQKPR